MRKILFAILCPLLLSSFIFCTCSSESTDPTLAEEMQKTLDNALNEYDLMGLSAAIIMPDQPNWSGVSGYSYDTTPITSDMLFYMESITKSYVAALVLHLSAEGLLTLEDSLDMWLPEYRYIDGCITIRQLLNHSSGVFDFSEHPTIWDEIMADLHRSWSPEEVITNFVLEPYFEPGTGWYYSNTNYFLLGMVIVEVTGSELSAELRQRFFNPLGLNNTFLAGEDDITGELAHGWYDLDMDGDLDDFSIIPRTAIDSLAWAAGGLVSTAEDNALWASYLFGGDILEQEQLDQMLDFIAFNSETRTGYGLGTCRFNYCNQTLWGHTGGGIDFSAILFYLPDEEVSFTVMCNQVDEGVISAGTDLLQTYLNFK
ncbi:serine hydrolase domain-containing protein [candidate division CSSED10-310 bacterium]|uniref:Serine hydrolase domain-containing protein n=1 Tax=candidate division CSSED10-310 bacterium TaxID=2855610 RepID=A0ABV6Z480_UNCC1